MSKYGLLLPVASLPSKYGIGDFGKNAYLFVDFLVKNNFSYWQILPLNPIGLGNSPYSSMCAKAIDPLYIDIDDLKSQKLIEKIPQYKEQNPSKINYFEVRNYKKNIFKIAYSNFIKNNEEKLNNFIESNQWVKEYSIFMYLCEKNNNKTWNEWEKDDINYDISKGFPEEGQETCNYTCFLQFIAYQQWKKLYEYIKSKNIKVIADCPFYVGQNSTECFFKRGFFVLKKDLNLKKTGGFPPDDFSDVGQVWNTAMFNFRKLKKNGYSLLVDRIGFLSSNYDYLRLDHFRGFVSYFSIPFGDLDAKRGKWKKGPGYGLFKKIFEKFPNTKLIAEDLGGEENKKVKKLKNKIHAPGMFVTQFNLFYDGAKSTKDQIVYPGTHDNSPIGGWIKSLKKKDLEYLNKKFKNPKNLHQAIFDFVLAQDSLLTIFQFQDLFDLDDSSRINQPGVMDDKNWTWKISDISLFNKVKYSIKN